MQPERNRSPPGDRRKLPHCGIVRMIARDERADCGMWSRAAGRRHPAIRALVRAQPIPGRNRLREIFTRCLILMSAFERL